MRLMISNKKPKFTLKNVNSEVAAVLYASMAGMVWLSY